MTRKDLSDLIFSKIEKNQDILSKQFEDSKNKIGFFYIDDLLPEEIAIQIHENFRIFYNKIHLSTYIVL